MKKFTLLILLFTSLLFSQEKIGSLKEAKNTNLTKEDLKGFLVSKDDFNGVVTYRYKKLLGVMYIEPIIKVGKGFCYIEVRTEFKGNSWIFLNDVTVLAKNEVFTYAVKDVDTDIRTSSVSEITFKLADENMINMLEALAKCDDYSLVKYRFSGGKGYYDLIVNHKEVRVFKEVMELYHKIIQ